MKMKKVTINQYTIDTIEKIKEIHKHIGDSKRFVLLRGSIGVGKTLIAKELAKKIVKNDYEFNCEFKDEVWTEQVAVVPFHSGTDYENLIYGLKLTTENKKLKYKATEQVVLNMLSKAESNKNKTYVVILDDVNRGNFAGAMGDVLSAVESDDVGNAIRPGNDETYTIPKNLYIIATFNPTISNPTIDYAWLRRFMVVDIFSDGNYIESLKNIRERNITDKKPKEKSDNFINETAKEKFTDYIFEIYMEIKILFERYFLDNDENVRKQYMIGHGLFMTYDENITPNDKSQTYKENAKKFSYQLRYCIVPLLYQYVKDGLLDEKAKLDIEAYEHFYDEGYQEFSINGLSTSTSTIAKPDTVRIYDLFSLIKALLNRFYDMPRAALYKFFFHNASMMIKQNVFYFDTEDIKNAKENEGLFGGNNFQIKSGDSKAVLYFPRGFSGNPKKNYKNMYYEGSQLEFVRNKYQCSTYYVSQQIIKWFLRAYEFNCCVNDHKYDEDKILEFLLDFNENNIDCKNRFYNILDLIFKKKEKFIEYKNSKAKKANTTT